MNLVHLHLLLNHLPVIGTGFALLLLVWGMLRRSHEVIKVSLVLFVVLALIAIPTYLTGEPAGESVEKLPGISKAAISRHDEAAEIALTAMEILGGVSLLGLLFFRRAARIPQWFAAVALLGAISVGGLMAYTANLGGQIRHSEISGVVSAGATAAARADDDD